jgi:hypothetical protein
VTPAALDSVRWATQHDQLAGLTIAVVVCTWALVIMLCIVGIEVSNIAIELKYWKR